MPFDLPPKARSPCLASSWQKALNYRDFQDKLLRVIQYSSRGVAFYLLRADPSHVLGTKLFNLCVTTGSHTLPTQRGACLPMATT